MKLFFEEYGDTIIEVILFGGFAAIMAWVFPQISDIMGVWVS